MSNAKPMPANIIEPGRQHFHVLQTDNSGNYADLGVFANPYLARPTVKGAMVREITDTPATTTIEVTAERGGAREVRFTADNGAVEVMRWAIIACVNPGCGA